MQPAARPDDAHDALRAQFAERLAALANVRIEDDGSLAVRLSDQPGLANAILGRSPLDPASVGSSRPSPAQAAILPPLVSRLVDVSGPVGVDDIDATLALIEDVRARVNALEALEGVLLERVRRQGLRADGLVDERDPMVRAAGPRRRRELALRAVVAEVALAVRQSEQAVTARMGQAQGLVARAPRTLAAAVAGDVAWANAGRLGDAVAELDEHTASRLDADVVTAAQHQNPRTFSRTVRRARERLCPAPAEVRHSEAATKRGVWTDPAADGMAYLTLFAPAPAVHAIADRLTLAAQTVRGRGDGRTLGQLRADVACALLLDDGTLDVRAAAIRGRQSATPTAYATATTPAAGAGAGAVRATEAARITDVAKSTSTASSAGAASARGASGVVEAVSNPLTPDAGNRTGEYERTEFSLAAIARAIRPRIYVTVPVLTLLGRTDAPALLDGVVPIDPETARELAGLATSFTRLLTHPETGRVLAVGSEAYRPPAELRHFVKVRDTTCRFPGCTRPAATTDVDHTLAHADHGPTTAGNLAHLCRRHHVTKHQTTFTVRQTDAEGALTWTTPTGRTHTTHPAVVPATIHRPHGPEEDPCAEPDPYGEPNPYGEPPF
ncbi:HNH endonuclease signature motif containing protein [Xylanimonas ulmi]|uniref:HNH endonuclease signature motif containing protein n=1 Tax=Xylanimonas ulmi TaxID=228973 RepID=UPI00102C5102|nr:HNH endonuclease signature motif containing protein [Xylanibacterium ulmi]